MSLGENLQDIKEKIQGESEDGNEDVSEPDLLDRDDETGEFEENFEQIKNEIEDIREIDSEKDNNLEDVENDVSSEEVKQQGDNEEKYSELENKVSELEQKIDSNRSLEERISRLEESIEQVKEEKDEDLKERLDELEEKCVEPQRDWEKLEDEIKDGNDFSKFEDRISELEESIEEKEGLKQEISALEDKFEERSELEEKFEDLDSRLSGLELDESEEVSRDYKGDIDDLREELEQAEVHETERIDSLASRVEKLELDIQNESIHEKAAQQRVMKLEERVGKLEEGRSMAGRLEELENDFIEFSNNLDNKIDERIEEKTEKRFERIEVDLESMDDRVKSVMKDVRDLTQIVKEKL